MTEVDAQAPGRARGMPVVVQALDSPSFVPRVAEVLGRPSFLLPVAQALGRPRQSHAFAQVLGSASSVPWHRSSKETSEVGRMLSTNWKTKNTSVSCVTCRDGRQEVATVVVGARRRTRKAQREEDKDKVTRERDSKMISLRLISKSRWVLLSGRSSAGCTSTVATRTSHRAGKVLRSCRWEYWVRG